MRLIPQAWRDLSALERDVLVGFAAHDEPTTTYQIYTEVNPEKDPNSVYKPARKLKEKGYLEQVAEGDENYEGDPVQITDQGRELVKQAVVDPALKVK
jgi:DNA-binding PadR family transcriptional regulator